MKYFFSKYDQIRITFFTSETELYYHGHKEIVQNALRFAKRRKT